MNALNKTSTGFRCFGLMLMAALLPFPSQAQHDDRQKSSAAYQVLKEQSVCESLSDGQVLCAINTGEGAYWFLLGGGILERKMLSGDNFPTSAVSSLKASPNGKFLALEHYGEGHSWIAVIDLPLLLNDGKFSEVQGIDPYPGGVGVDVWRGAALQVESDMLLTHRVNKEGSNRVPDELTLPSNEKFSLNMVTGEITPVNAELKDPGMFYGKALLSPRYSFEEKRDTILPALKFLKSDSSLPYLHRALKRTAYRPLQDEIRQVLAEMAKK